MRMRRGFTSLVVIGILLVLGSVSSPKTIAPLWNYRIENMTSFAMSRNGEYIIVACEKGPLCEKGQFYVFDRYGNTVTHGCIDSEITAVDIADNSAFFIGTEKGYYFSSGSGEIQEDLEIRNLFESVSISENGEIVIAGTDKGIFILDNGGVKSRKEINQPINFTAISGSGDIAAAGTRDKIFLYKQSTNTWVERPTIAKVSAMAVSDNGNIIACGMITGMIWILDSQLNLQSQFKVQSRVTAITLTADGSHLVSGTREGEISYQDLSNKSSWNKDVKNTVDSIAISSGGKLVAVLCEDIVLFDFSGNKLQELKSSETIQNIYLSHSGDVFSYCSSEDLSLIEFYQYKHSLTYEYPFPSRKSIPLGDQLTQIWTYRGDSPRGAKAADIDGNGLNEIICNFDKEIVVFNREGRVLWKKQFQCMSGLNTMDLTGDLIPEVVVYPKDNRMSLQIFDGNGQELAVHEFYSRWYSEPPGPEWNISIVPYWSNDIDNDGFIEVVCVVYAGYIKEPRGFYVFEYPSFREEWYYPVATPLAMLSFVDVNGDEEVEIIAGSNAPCNTRQIGSTDDCHAYVYAVTLEGKELWTKQIGPGGYKRVDVAVADLDGDGNQEIIGSGWSFENNWGTLFVLDSEGSYILGDKNEFDHSIFLEVVADLDNDGDLEILTSTTTALILYDHKLREIKEQSVSIKLGQNAVVRINDIDADDEKEIVLTSDDTKLLILNSTLEEEWSETFPGYVINRMKTFVVNLNKCKNYLLVLADKLYAYTYSSNPDWPCTPWVITEQQKMAEAQTHTEKGNKCLAEEDCECAKTGFIQAKEAYEQIQNEEDAAQANGRIHVAENCFIVQNSFEEVKKLFEEADSLLAGIYLSTPEKYLSEAENLLSEMDDYLGNAKKGLSEISDYLTEVGEAYEDIWGKRSEEIEEYYKKIEEIRTAMEYLGIGREQIDEGRIDEETKSNLQKAMGIFNKYGWPEHVKRTETLIFSMPRVPDNGLSTLEKAGAISSIISVVVAILIFIYQERIKELLRKKSHKAKLNHEKSKEEIEKRRRNKKEKIGDFRIKRIKEIKNGDNLAVKLDNTAKIVLHIVPSNAFDLSAKFDLTSLASGDLPLLCRPPYTLSHQFNSKGFLAYWENLQKKCARSYVQLFDNGIIEAVDTCLLTEGGNSEGNNYILQRRIERRLLDVLRSYLSFQEQLGVELPLFIMLSYLGVHGREILHPITQDDLLLPEIVIDSFECNLAKAMKPAFDEIWKASGFPRSMNYDDEGKWKESP